MVNGQETAFQTAGANAGRLKKAFLVTEGGAASHWVFADFQRWLPADGTQIQMIDAVPELSDSSWFKSDDTRNYVESMVVRHGQMREELGRSAQLLSRDGYELTGSAYNIASDEGLKEIVREIEQSGAELLVIATPPKAMEKDHPVSGFALHLISHVNIPVLLLRRPLNSTTAPTLKVLFGTDDTDASANAARRLPQLLRPEALRVSLVTVQNDFYADNGVVAPYVNREGIEEALAENGQMTLTIAKDLLESSGVTVEKMERVTGTPAWTLIDMLRREEPDLMVVGSHNRHGLSSWILGSVSQRLAQSDNHNLLIIR